MLDQKRRSLLRGIRLDYRIDGVPLSPLPPEELAKIQADLDALDEQIATAEAEAARYRGGLIQGLALSTLATHPTHASDARPAALPCQARATHAGGLRRKTRAKVTTRESRFETRERSRVLPTATRMIK